MNSAPYIIKQAEKCNIDDLIKLRAYLLDHSSACSYSCKTEEEKSIWRDRYRSWLNDIIEHCDDIRIVVCTYNGQAIGCATAIIDRRAPARDCISGLSGWIQSVVVEKYFQRNGIAASLLQLLTEWFTVMGVSKIVLESTPEAEKFYITKGFIPGDEVLFTKEI